MNRSEENLDEIKQEQMDLMSKSMYNIYKQYKNYQSDAESLFPEGITSTELSIIQIVNERPEIIIKEVSEYLELPGSTLTSAIDRLEQKKLIRRIVSQRNRRSLGLELTDAGREINVIHEKAEQKIGRRILSRFDNSEDRETFLRLLGVLATEIKEENN